jgi:hypothetical protein
LDAHLQGNRAAREWLEGKGCKALLAPADRWQRK